jgi:hypothetical protein
MVLTLQADSLITQLHLINVLTYHFFNYSLKIKYFTYPIFTLQNITILQKCTLAAKTH